MIDEVEKRFTAARAPVTFIKVHHQPDGHFERYPEPAAAGVPPGHRRRGACASGGIRVSPVDGDFDRASRSMTRRVVYRGVLHCRSAGGSGSCRNSRGKIHSRPASDVEHGGHRDLQRQPAGDVEDRHAFIKERMRGRRHLRRGDERAPLRRDFAYCDSGMIPWLLVAGCCALEEQLAEIAGGGPP